MPQIPQYDQQVSARVGVPDNPQIRPSPVYGAVSNVLGQAADVLDRQAQADAAVEGLSVLTNFRIAQAQRQEQLRSEAKSPDGFVPSALKDFDAQWATLTSSVSSDRVRSYLDAHIGDARTDYAESALHWEVAARQERRVADVTEGLNGLGAIILRNPASYQNALREWDTTLASSGIDAAQIDKLRLAGRQQLAVSYGDALIRSDPTRALQAFATDQSFTSLDPDKLYALQARADAKIQHQVAMSDHAAIVAERQRKLAGDQLAKEGEDLIAQGKMTEEWMQQNRATLDPSDYRILRHAMQEGGGVDTAPAMASILKGIYADGTDQAPAILQALDQKQITPQTAKSLLDDNKASAPSPVIQARSFITQYMKPSDLERDTAAQQRFAEAMAEFNRRISEDPKQDPMGLARDVVKRNAAIDYSTMTLVMPLPRYAVGSRQNLDIAASQKATLDAFMARHNGDRAAALADPEFQNEALVLKRWKDAADRKAAAEAATQSGGLK